MTALSDSQSASGRDVSALASESLAAPERALASFWSHWERFVAYSRRLAEANLIAAGQRVTDRRQAERSS